MNIAIITLDSLRFDVAEAAATPNFRQLIALAGLPNWVRVGCHGTYTLPSHIAMFANGYLPNRNEPDVPGPYNSDKVRLFRVVLNELPNTKIVYPTSPNYPNIVRGFAGIGYRTVAVGGVGWFRNDVPTSSFWERDFFDEVYWNTGFHEAVAESFENQINLCHILHLGDSAIPLFFFLNVASTHFPYRVAEVDNGLIDPKREHQQDALQYVDSHFPELLDMLPRPLHLIIFGDHGDCFGEDGKWSHGFFHPKVMEVPMLSLILES